MEILTLNGIVLKEYPVGENDKFIHIFTTERGVIELSVKGGRKLVGKNSGGSQLFSYSRFSMRSDKGRYFLDSCEPIHLFYGVREDLSRIALASYIAEVVSYVAGQHEQKKELMRLILNILHFLSNGQRSCNFLKCVFEMRFMTEIGMMPDIVCCQECMSYESKNMLFDLLSTKLYCAECFRGKYDPMQMRISGSVVRALRHIVFADFNRLFNFRLSHESMEKLGLLTERYLIIHIGREFKTLDFYRSLGIDDYE